MPHTIFSAYPSQFENMQHLFAQNTPHHGWILAGPKGVGKAQFAEALAAFLLGGTFPFPAEVWVPLQANSYPNFLKITPADETAQGITVDQIRALKDFAQKTTQDGSWKIILINSLNDLGVNGANALLKILEEPQPKTLFFLIFHNGGVLLPTIRSRCTLVSFQPQTTPSPSSVGEAIAAGRPKMLARIQTPDFQTLLTQNLSLLQTPALNYQHIYAFVQSVYKDAEKFDLAVEIMLWWVNTLIKAKASPDTPFKEIFVPWLNLPLSAILKVHRKILKLLNDQKSLHLDKRHTLLGFFFELNSLTNSIPEGNKLPTTTQYT